MVKKLLKKINNWIKVNNTANEVEDNKIIEIYDDIGCNDNSILTDMQ